MKLKLVARLSGCLVKLCPSIYEDEETGDFIIRGKNVSNIESDLKIGDGESMVRIPKELIHQIVKDMK